MDILTSLSQPVMTLRSRARQERAVRESNNQAIKDMPYVYGLMAVAASSGLSPESSMRCVSEYVPPSISESMNKAMLEIDAGRSFRSSLLCFEDYPHLRPLAHILNESMESGTSSLATLDSLGRDAMNKVRRKTDIALKRLPITMLFPLVTCILPSFILLSVVPTLINGFMSFHW